MLTHLTTRGIARALLLTLVACALGGCVASEKSRYDAHLSVVVSPNTASDNVSAGAFSDE